MNVVTIIGAIVLVIGMMLIIIQNFSPITSAIIINGTIRAFFHTAYGF